MALHATNLGLLLKIQRGAKTKCVVVRLIPEGVIDHEAERSQQQQDAREQGQQPVEKENPRTYATTGGFQLLANREWGQGGRGCPAGLARDVEDWLKNCHRTPRRRLDIGARLAV